jgi:hypothetical protein
MARSFEIALAQPDTTAEILYLPSPDCCRATFRDSFFPRRGRLWETDQDACAGSSPRSKEKGRSTPRGSGPGKQELYRERELPMPMLGEWPSKTAPYGN